MKITATPGHHAPWGDYGFQVARIQETGVAFDGLLEATADMASKKFSAVREGG